jgi:hypothetical protein
MNVVALEDGETQFDQSQAEAIRGVVHPLHKAFVFQGRQQAKHGALVHADPFADLG